MIKKIINFLFASLILFLPFIFFPSQGSLGWELPKVFFFQTTVKAIWLLFALRLFLEKKKLKGKPLLTSSFLPFLFLLSLFLWFSFSSALGFDPHNSFNGSIWRRQGLLFWLHGTALVFLLANKSISLNKNTLGFLVSFSALGESLLALSQFVRLNFLDQTIINYNGRIVGTFGQPNFLAGFLAISLPFVLLGFSQAKNSKQKTFFLATSFFSILTILLTFSQGGILALLVIGLFWLFKKSKRRIILLFFLLPLILLFPLFGKKIQETRLPVWQKAIQAIVKRPLTGYGLDNFKSALGDGVVFGTEEAQWVKTVDRTHNLFLDMALVSGVVGLLLFLALLFIVSKRLLTKDKDSHFYCLSLLAFIGYGFFNTYSLVHWFYFFLIVGLASTKMAREKT